MIAMLLQELALGGPVAVWPRSPGVAIWPASPGQPLPVSQAAVRQLGQLAHCLRIRQAAQPCPAQTGAAAAVARPGPEPWAEL